MTLTTFEDVQYWFNNNQSAGDKTAATHWTLYGGDWGEKETRLLSNTRINKPEESLSYLIETIRKMNNPKGTKFKVILYRPGASNNYTAQTYIQIFDNAGQPGANAAIAGIGMLPPQIDERYITERIELAMLKKENEDLKEAINGPSNSWERFLEIIGQNEALSNALAGVLMGFAGKSGLPPATFQRPVTGTANTDDDNEAGQDLQQAFIEDVNAAASALQTDAVTMMRKLRQMVKENPEYAKQMFSQI